MADIKGAVSSISAACATLQESRRKRIGSRTTNQFWDDLVSLNKQIKAAVDEKQAGMLRSQKALWFNYRLLNDEIANLGAVLNVVEHIVDDDVLEEISAAGYDRSKVMRLIGEGRKMLARIRSDIALHEDNLARKLEGASISDDSLNRLEYRIAGSLHALEDSVLKIMPATAGEVSRKPSYETAPTRRKFLTWAAASLTLAAASAYGMKAQGQESVKVKPPELTDKNIEDLVGLGTVEEVLNENKIIPGAKIIYVKYDETTKTSNLYELLGQIKEDGAIIALYLNGENQDRSQRAAIIAKLACIQFNLPLVPYNGNFDSRKADFVPAVKERGTLTTPSLFLVSRYNLVNGETPEKNNGQMKIVDVIRGGPLNNEALKKWHKNLTAYWIPTNITQPNGKFVWRSLNSDAKWNKIEYSK